MNLNFISKIIVFDTYDFYVNSDKNFINSNIEKNQNQFTTFIDFFKYNNIPVFNDFMNRPIIKFPVIKLYTTTLLGQKCCLNIHNFFPYFYIELTKDNMINYHSKETLKNFAYLIENTFISYSNLKESEYNINNDTKDNNDNQIIHNISVCEKFNIYGYYNKCSIFLKIEVYNCDDIKLLMNLLSGKNILNKFYQCFDAHISYSVHFFGDNNLEGMGLIKLKNFSFRYRLKDNCNIDFQKKFLNFESNLIWDNINIINDNDNNNNLMTNSEEIKNYILNNNKFIIWDEKNLKFLNSQIIYNKFIKKSKSEIELDCIYTDIIKTNDIKNDLIPNKNNNSNSINKEIGNEVDLNNLKNHIKHCPSLIDLWKDEILRRENKNLPKLLFQKISNQNVHTLTDNYILTYPKESEFLLKNNYSLKLHYKNNNNNNNIEKKYLDLTEENINIININKIKDFIIYEKKLKSYDYNFCFNWFKNNKLNDNIISYKNYYDNKEKYFKEKNYYNNEYNKNNSEGEGDEEDINEEEDIEIDLNCFNTKRTFNERSFSNSIRQEIKSIVTNKNLEDCFDSNNIKYSNEKNNLSIVKEEKYSLLKKPKKNFYNNNNSNEISKIYDKSKFIIIFNYLMWFINDNKPVTYNDIKKKLNKNNFFYNKNSNKNLNNIHYNLKDCVQFFQKSFKINNNLQITNQNSLNFMFNRYNKIRLKEKYIASEYINKRNLKIFEIIKNINNNDCLKNINNDKNEYKIDDNNLLFNLEGGKYLFPFKKKVTYNDFLNKINKKKEIKNINNKKNKIFLNKYYNKLNDNYSNLNNNTNNFNNNSNINSILINQTYFNEISPITEKQIKNNEILTLNFSNKSLKSNNNNIINNNNDNNQIITYLDKLNQKEQNPLMTILSCEIFANSLSNLSFNFETDEILALFITIHDYNAQTNLELFSNEYNYYRLIITNNINKNLAYRFNYSKFILRPEYTCYNIKHNDNNNIDNKEDINFKNITEIIFVKDEIGIINKFIEIVRIYDPDIITGYETEFSSIGYIVHRSNYLGINIKHILSRNLNNFDIIFNEEFMQKKMNENFLINKNKNTNNNVKNYTDFKEINYLKMKIGNAIKIKGRIIINISRLINQEIKTNDYSIENIIFLTFNIRLSSFSYFSLKNFYISTEIKKIIFVFNYYMTRTEFILKILKHYDIINRCSQFVKMYGIDFESGITRGSQYRVEGVLSRLVKEQNFLLLSATRSQLMTQIPPRVTPIVIEPPKNIFYNPVIVLDFQSLYPSIMIAYNVCYSTCLGKLIEKNIEEIEEKYKKFGVNKYDKNLYDMLYEDFKKSSFFINNDNKNKNNTNNNDSNINEINEKNFLLFLKQNTFISPNKTIFVTKNIRLGFIPIILSELLLTRIMIKNSMKLYPKDSLIYTFLHNRQLGIKNLANVIYGYTSAGFSGRMPNTDIGDTTVSLGRIILTNSKNYIEKNYPYAKVIYGDTDSMFISIENKSIEESIIIGKEMADKITKLNPEPIKLSFEKVYCPLVFNSKKHYAGYKYENNNDLNKTILNLDSKGLENVRRDKCELVSIILEKMIKILFETKNLSKLKKYLFKCFDKIISGKTIIKNFIFSKEVKLGKYKSDRLPASALIADNLHKKDKNFFALYKQRIPYLVYYGKNGQKEMKNNIIHPLDFFSDINNTINAEYYIEFVITMVKRFLEPLGVDIELWMQKYEKPCLSYENYYFVSSWNFNHNNNDKNDNENNDDKKNFFKSSYNLKSSPNIMNFLSNDKFEYKKYDQKNIYNKFNYNTNNIYPFKYKNKLYDTLKYCINNEYFDEKESKEILKKINNSKILLIAEYKRKKILYKKYEQFNIICKKCSTISKYNIDIEDIPCINYQCKIFYDKQLVKNQILKFQKQ